MAFLGHDGKVSIRFGLVREVGFGAGAESTFEDWLFAPPEQTG